MVWQQARDYNNTNIQLQTSTTVDHLSALNCGETWPEAVIEDPVSKMSITFCFQNTKLLHDMCLSHSESYWRRNAASLPNYFSFFTTGRNQIKQTNMKSRVSHPYNNMTVSFITVVTGSYTFMNRSSNKIFCISRCHDNYIYLLYQRQKVIGHWRLDQRLCMKRLLTSAVGKSNDHKEIQNDESEKNKETQKKNTNNKLLNY